MDAMEIVVKKTKEGDDDPDYTRADVSDQEVENPKWLRDHSSPYLTNQLSSCLEELYDFDIRRGDLEELHNRNAIRGDLKTENILLFNLMESGTFTRGSWGEATIHGKKVRTINREQIPIERPLNVSQYGTRQYVPPKRNPQRHASEARSYQHEIWALGRALFHIFREIAYSPSDNMLYQDNTPYFWQSGHEREHRSSVAYKYIVAVMENPDRHCEPGAAYKDLLNLVRKRLSIVSLSSCGF
jgi:serine/threonine protein kinase